MKIVNISIFLNFVNLIIISIIKWTTSQCFFIYAYPLISFCIDNLCYLPKLFNTALYETDLGDSFYLDQVLWKRLPNSTFT